MNDAERYATAQDDGEVQDAIISEQKTLAQQLQFQLQFMGFMGMCGRDEERDVAYVKAQEYCQKLIDEGH
jgi:inorganic pyrophosphatase